MCKRCNICVERINRHICNTHHKKGEDIQKFLKKYTETPKVTVSYMGNEEIESSSSEEDQPVAKSNSLLPHAKKMTSEDKKAYKIGKNERFAYHFNTCQELLQDFENWNTFANGQTTKSAKQTVSNLTSIWKVLDDKMRLRPNKLASYQDLEDKFFVPLFLKIQQKSNESLKPSTVMGKLSSIRTLIQFLLSRDVYIGKQVITSIFGLDL